MTASVLAGREDNTLAWCLMDQASARFHAEAARYMWAEGNLHHAIREQNDAAFYASLARINLLRLLGTISLFEQDV